MTPGYEPFELVERHGVGNMLRLLWAYTLHRGSERLANTARRVLERTGSFEASWTEISAVQDASHPDVGRSEHTLGATPRLKDAPQHGTKEAVSVTKTMHDASSPQNAELVGLDRGRELEPHPIGASRAGIASMPSNEPEPWFRALQVAHRSLASMEQGLSAGSEELGPGRIGDDFHGAVPDVPIESEDVDKFECEELPHPQEPPVEAVSAKRERTSQSLGRVAMSLPDVAGEESSALIAEDSSVDLAARDLGMGTHAEVIPEDLQLVASEHTGTPAKVSLEYLAEEAVAPERWPALPVASPSWTDTPTATAKRFDVVQAQDPPPYEGAPQRDVLDARVVAKERPPVRRTVALPDVLPRSEQSMAEWADLEGPWPSLHEEPRYAGAAQELERYQRGQRRWDEQRGNL